MAKPVPAEIHKLNIGCGADYRKGYWNVDVGPFRVDDSVDIFGPLPWIADRFDEIFARDVLEHTSWSVTEDVLKRWLRVLKPGGKITIQVPNALHIAQRYVGGSITAKQFSYWMFGGHGTSHGCRGDHWRLNAHYAGFDRDRLTELAAGAGLKVESLRSDGGSNLILVATKV